MTDDYWRLADSRQQQQQQLAAPQSGVVPASVPSKRSRSDYGGPPELHVYLPRSDDIGRDSGSMYSHYDPYLQNGLSSYAAPAPVRPIGGGRPVDSGVIGYGGGRMEPPLPPDASNTLFVEGLPSDCTRREVSHIFRPFVGFQEVRLVNKESKHPGGDPFVLCFVDFSTASQAALALDALQGYSFDEHDREAPRLKLQFARFPGPRSGGGPRSRR